MGYLNIPMSGVRPPSNEELKKFFTAIANTDGKVYCHCIDGRDRTGVMSAIYDIVARELTPEQAIAEMNKYKNPKGINKFPKLNEFIQKFGSDELKDFRAELRAMLDSKQKVAA